MSNFLKFLSNIDHFEPASRDSAAAYQAEARAIAERLLTNIDQRACGAQIDYSDDMVYGDDPYLTPADIALICHRNAVRGAQNRARYGRPSKKQNSEKTAD